MTTVLCTLFNSLYLDKGLVLYDSLCECAKDFMLYVLCMDEKCYEVLTDLNQDHLIPIKLNNFECDELLKVKPTRSFGEYFWTCSSWLISYVLETFNPENCTYIDADMYFYNDPAEIIEEMYARDASVLIVGHRFHPFLAEEKAHIVGKYCVEFNTFKNDEKARGLLDIWKHQVLEHCSLDGDGVYWGDQKYMDNWPADYGYVIETSHLGAGVAPWNISQYNSIGIENGKTCICIKKQKCNLIFYHFENIEYISESRINSNVECFWGIKKNVLNLLYIPYLRKIRIRKDFLKKEYNINVINKRHPGVAQRKADNSITMKMIYFIGRQLKNVIAKKSLSYPFNYIFRIKVPKFLFKGYRIIEF